VRRFAVVALSAASLLVGGCDRSTAKLTPAQEQQFAAEGILRRADDQIFRYTRDPGRRTRWEDRRASIVVTKSSLLIHKNAKVGLEITPRTRKDVSVERSGGRVRIRSGRGRSEEVWSFEPPDDPEGWTTDIRQMIRQNLKGQ
jgi:hypothetical protein